MKLCKTVAKTCKAIYGSGFRLAEAVPEVPGCPLSRNSSIIFSLNASMSFGFRVVTRLLSKNAHAKQDKILGLRIRRGKMQFGAPMWRNGRRNGLKIRFH
jgi:hypothetical protein